MKKTYNINLNSQVFTIDEDALNQLQSYIETLEKYYFQEEDGKEIMADIESRIAELLQNSLNKYHKEVVSQSDIAHVIEIMGTPDVIIDEDQDNTLHSPKVKRKLYRDSEDAILGGVASGFAAYLSISVIWIRIGLIISALFYGITILIYIILWIVIPKAITSKQKLEMKGETINVSNIEKNIRNTIDDVTSNNKFNHYLQQIGQGISHFFSVLWGIVRKLFNILGNLLAIIGLVGGSSAFLFTSGLILWGHHYLPENCYVFLQYASSPIPLWINRLTLLFLIGIPLLLIVYFSIIHLFKLQGHKTIVLSSIGFWIVSCLVGIFLTIGILSQYYQEYEDRNELSLASSNQSNTLNISFNNLPFSQCKRTEFNLHGYLHHYTRISPEDSTRIHFRPHITFVPSKEVHPKLIFTQKARGISNQKAAQNIENIQYTYEWKNDTLHLDTYFSLQHPQWRFNETNIKIFIPENYQVNLQNIIPCNISNYIFQNTQKFRDDSKPNRQYVMRNQKLHEN